MGNLLLLDKSKLISPGFFSQYHCFTSGVGGFFFFGVVILFTFSPIFYKIVIFLFMFNLLDGELVGEYVYFHPDSFSQVCGAGNVMLRNSKVI